MSMQLYGTLASVYVRRIRLALEDFDYEMKLVNVYDDIERQAFTQISPIRRIPVLVDGDQSIWDSHVIYQYLCDKRGQAGLSVEQHNLVSVIDAATDSMIILFQSRSSGVETPKDKLFFKLQHERVISALNWLEQQAKAGAFDDWNYPTMCMLATVAWAEFRGIDDVKAYPELLKVPERFSEREVVRSTQPQL